MAPAVPPGSAPALLVEVLDLPLLDRLLVAGEVRQVSAGTAVLFPQGAIHMLHNTGSEEMKVVCFFAPATGLDNYRLHEGVDFPD